MPKYVTKFSESWLTNPEYKSWLAKKNDSTASCKICMKDIDISNMGEAAVKSHMKGKKHIAKLPPPKSASSSFATFRIADPQKKIDSPEESSSSATPSTTKTSSGTSSGVVQSTLDTVVERDSVLAAEIRWVLKCVQSKYSQRSCDGLQELLNVMFPGHNIIEKFTLGKTKCSYILNYGLAPFFTDLLEEEVKLSPKYGLSFDESLNKKLQKGQMDILVRYWDWERHIAQTRYLNSEFLGGAKSEQILENFVAGSKRLDHSKMIQVSSDGPNVNLKFLNLYDEKRDLDEFPSLVDIGTCGLHTIHGSLKTGVKLSGWEIGKILKAMFKLLDESPARRDVFRDVTETDVFPLPYCGHRWCENENCLFRAVAIWPAYVVYIEKLNKLKSYQQPKGKSFPTLQQAIKDPLLTAKFKLVEMVANKLNVFLRGFQTDQPMVPFLAEVLKDILSSIMNMFILDGRFLSYIRQHLSLNFLEAEARLMNRLNDTDNNRHDKTDTTKNLDTILYLQKENMT